MTGDDDARRRFERYVLVEFQRALFEYCQLAIVHPRVDPATLRIRITVVTGPPVETIRTRVRELARQTVRHELDGAELLGVNFARDMSGQDHGCRILIHPPLPDAETDPGHRSAQRESRTPDGPTMPFPGVGTDHSGGTDFEHNSETGLGDHPGQSWTGSHLLVLTLAYEDRLRWRYPLLPGPTWIPLGRGLVAAESRSAIRVPDFVTAVPRGPLLMLRYLPGVVTLLRSTERPGYTVTVDGRPVPPGGTTAVRDAGSIHYVLARSAASPATGPSPTPAAGCGPGIPRTTLTYRFEQGL